VRSPGPLRRVLRRAQSSPGSGGCSVADGEKPNGEKQEERLYDLFKHMTTLNAAAIAAIIAARAAFDADLVAVLLALACFGVSLVLAVEGMFDVVGMGMYIPLLRASMRVPEALLRLIMRDPPPPRPVEEYYARFCLALFVFGVLASHRRWSASAALPVAADRTSAAGWPARAGAMGFLNPVSFPYAGGYPADRNAVQGLQISEPPGGAVGRLF
jgi:hypothetical protein